MAVASLCLGDTPGQMCGCVKRPRLQIGFSCHKVEVQQTPISRLMARLILPLWRDWRCRFMTVFSVRNGLQQRNVTPQYKFMSFPSPHLNPLRTPAPVTASVEGIDFKVTFVLRLACSWQTSPLVSRLPGSPSGGAIAQVAYVWC